MTKTTKSSLDNEFDRLLLEAWEWCAEDDKLRASPAYRHVRRLLCELTPRDARGPDELARLERAVCALRAGRHEDLCLAPSSLRQSSSTPPPPPPPPRPSSPAPPEVARAAAECALKAALEAHGCRAGLPRFYGEVAALTCDRGALLARVTDAVLTDFRAGADAMLGNRVSQIGTVLGRDQTAARVHFAALARRAANRARLAVTYVRDAMPAFDWNRYAAEPGYMRLVAVRPRPGCVPRADDADDADGARGKRLLYQVNWLRSEIDRADAENRCLYEQHTGLAAVLAAVNRDVSRAQTDAAARARALSGQLDELRARSAGMACRVDRLMDRVQTLVARDARSGPGADDPCAGAAAAAVAAAVAVDDGGGTC